MLLGIQAYLSFLCFLDFFFLSFLRSSLGDLKGFRSKFFTFGCTKENSPIPLLFLRFLLLDVASVPFSRWCSHQTIPFIPIFISLFLSIKLLLQCRLFSHILLILSIAIKARSFDKIVGNTESFLQTSVFFLLSFSYLMRFTNTEGRNFFR